MPVDLNLYPANWTKIATGVKDAARWHCQQCGRPCRKPGVEWGLFVNYLLDLEGAGGWYAESAVPDGNGGMDEKPQRFTLTVAHLDQNPSNNAPGNLRALCSVCHLEYDKSATQQFRRRQVNLERRGQMRLLD